MGGVAHERSSNQEKEESAGNGSYLNHYQYEPQYLKKHCGIYALKIFLLLAKKVAIKENLFEIRIVHNFLLETLKL